MAKADSVITDHIDIWTSAIKKRSATGRGSNKKIELTGIKKLRELILELAVRGQLVAQDPNDEPASVLLEKIAAEKAQLIKDKKIKKQKVLPEIRGDENPFGLPDGWQWMRLGYSFNSIISGGTPSKSNPLFWDGDIPWASVKDLGVKKYITSTQDYITKAGLDDGSKLADKGDILICTRMGLGKITIANIPIAFNQDLKAVKLTSKLDVEFFLNSFSTLKIKGTGTTVAGIKQEELLSYVIGLPPLPEQHRIVAKVDELMALCDQLEQQTENSITAHQTLVETLLATLTSSENTEAFNQSWARIAAHFDTLFTTEHSIDQLKQTVLQLAVMGKLVPQDPNDEPASVLLEKIAAEKLRLENEKKLKTKATEYIDSSEYYLATPLTWKFCRLGNLAKFIDYRGKTPTKLPNGVRLITAKNVKFGHISLQPEEFISKEEYISWMTRGIPRVGDILFTPEAPLGNIAIINIEEKFALAQRAICFQFHEKNLSKFLKIVIMSISFQNQLIKNASGMTATGIKASKLKEIPIPIPPLLEQHRIVKKVDELITLCDQLKARLSAAQTTQLQLADTIVEQAVN